MLLTRQAIRGPSIPTLHVTTDLEDQTEIAVFSSAVISSPFTDESSTVAQAISYYNVDLMDTSCEEPYPGSSTIQLSICFKYQLPLATPSQLSPV